MSNKVAGKYNPFDTSGVGGVTFGTPTTESSDARTISLQLTDRAGRDTVGPKVVWVYLSLNATGVDVVSSAASSALAAGTDGSVFFAGTTGKCTMFQSEADGDLDVVITDTAVRTLYLCVVLADGSVAVSPAIAFA